jgi:hypothetical protein
VSTALKLMLEDAIQRVNNQYDKCIHMLSQLAQIDDDDEHRETYDKQVNELTGRRQELLIDLLHYVGECDNNLRPTKPIVRGFMMDEPEARVHAPPASQIIRAKPELKPKTLTMEASPLEFDTWLQNFEGYFIASGCERASAFEQQAYFRSCVDQYIQDRIEPQVHPQRTFVLEQSHGEISCIQILKEEFLQKWPVLSRRDDFYSSRQKQGQLFTDWAAKLKRLRDEAQIQNMTLDDHLIMRYLTGMKEGRLKERFMELTDPTLDQLHRIALNHEKTHNVTKASASSEKTGSTGAKANKVNGGGNGKNGASVNLIDTSFLKKLQKDNRCVRCGENMKEHHAESCTGKDATCSKCGKKGHKQSVCALRGSASSSGSGKKRGQKNNSKSQKSEKTAPAPAPAAANTAKVYHKGDSEDEEFRSPSRQ